MNTVSPLEESGMSETIIFVFLVPGSWFLLCSLAFDFILIEARRRAGDCTYTHKYHTMCC